MQSGLSRDANYVKHFSMKHKKHTASAIEFEAGNKVALLNNGDEFVPDLVEEIARATEEVLIETYEFAEDDVGKSVFDACKKAVANGAEVKLTIDAYGSSDFCSDDFIFDFVKAGIKIYLYEPKHRLPFNAQAYGRLHRKLAVIDNKIGYVGGVNLTEKYTLKFGEDGMRDFMLRIEGPATDQVRKHCLENIPDDEPYKDEATLKPARDQGNTELALTCRDNHVGRRRAIEMCYLDAINEAKHSITLACAYFFPGLRLRHALRKAADRGVKVRLIFQKKPDIPLVLTAARSHYAHFLHHGIEIYEYKTRPLHAKVAAIDDNWCTIGSSNLDPWSLTLNLEANILVKDSTLTRELRGELETLIDESEAINKADYGRCVSLKSIGYRVSWWFFRLLLKFAVLIKVGNPLVRRLRRDGDAIDNTAKRLDGNKQTVEHERIDNRNSERANCT